MYVFTKLALSSLSNFIVAIAAIYWSILAWLERYLGVFAALSTGCGEHFPLGGPGAIATIPIAL